MDGARKGEPMNWKFSAVFAAMIVICWAIVSSWSRHDAMPDATVFIVAIAMFIEGIYIGVRWERMS